MRASLFCVRLIIFAAPPQDGGALYVIGPGRFTGKGIKFYGNQASSASSVRRVLHLLCACDH
jgi:hypothetical protein